MKQIFLLAAFLLVAAGAYYLVAENTNLFRGWNPKPAGNISMPKLSR